MSEPKVVKSKLWVELEEGLEMLPVPGGAILRSTSETTESMVLIPGGPTALLKWAEEFLPTKEQ